MLPSIYNSICNMQFLEYLKHQNHLFFIKVPNYKFFQNYFSFQFSNSKTSCKHGLFFTIRMNKKKHVLPIIRKSCFSCVFSLFSPKTYSHSQVNYSPLPSLLSDEPSPVLSLLLSSELSLLLSELLLELLLMSTGSMLVVSPSWFR